MQQASTHPDPIPNTLPQEFLDAVFTAVANERARLHINPEDPIDLTLVVDNAHVYAYLGEDDARGYPVMGTVAGGTNSISVYREYRRPIDAVPSEDSKIDLSNYAFDPSATAKNIILGNVTFTVVIGKSPHASVSSAGVAHIRFSQWNGAGQSFVDKGDISQTSDGMFEVLTVGYNDNFDDKAFRNSRVFSKGLDEASGYNRQVFQGILEEARKHGGMPNATNEEVMAHLLPQALSVIDDVKDGLPYVAYSFRCTWSAMFNVITHKAAIISATDQANLYPAPKKLSINIDGQQTTKIFFDPQVKVTRDDGTKTLPQNWAGRILPGQTIKEGIAAELKEVYGYTGRFEYSNVYFKAYAKDRKGCDIERYAVTITLLPAPDDNKLPL